MRKKYKKGKPLWTENFKIAETAWHEAGHATAYWLLYGDWAVEYISVRKTKLEICPKTRYCPENMLGCCKSWHQSTPETSIAGYVAESIMTGNWDSDQQSMIFDYTAEARDDPEYIEQLAPDLRQLPREYLYEEKFTELFERTYQLLLPHKKSIRRLGKRLMREGYICGYQMTDHVSKMI